MCHLIPWQRYNFKLDAAQTQKMIKFAVTRPAERARHIMQNMQKLGWAQDPYLREMGIKVQPNMAMAEAKIIPNPQVLYGNGLVNPGTTGRWDLRGRTFLAPGHIPLKSWAVVSTTRMCDDATARAFATQLANTFQKHGGLMTNRPIVLSNYNTNPASTVLEAFQECRKKFGPPQLLVFILPDKSQLTYNRFKKSCECRLGILSQMVNVQHVKKNQAQYHSNVCMKLNAKMGGQNNRAVTDGPKSSFFKRPTIIIGCDVSHGAAALSGNPEPSMAAMTVSMDRDTVRYAAACQTNGFRTEIVSPMNIKNMLPPLLQKWHDTFNNLPPSFGKDVFFLRDGVAEGQYNQVLEYEVKAIRDVFSENGWGKANITCIIATKRHHIRFFPDKAFSDRNGNPLPGTLVEHEVTHPWHYDFYLCSHVAIQGTARPVHYNVILDEVKLSPDDLQRIIYSHSYQYQRSTTPVSLHPAVYYAHLACARARAHEDVSMVEKDPKHKAEKLAAEMKMLLYKKKPEDSTFCKGADSLPLLRFGCDRDFASEELTKITRNTMWFI